MENKDLDKILEFMIHVDELKHVNRTGWVIKNIHKQPEHVADHSFSTALLSYIMAKRLKLDAGKCMAMALTHDIHEVITGDIPTTSISRKEKRRLAQRDTLKMLSHLDKTDQKALLSLWKEMSAQKSPEAKLVRQIDALDYIIQTVPYSKLVKNNQIFDDFFLTARERIHTPELLYMYNKIKRQILEKSK